MNIRRAIYLLSIITAIQMCFTAGCGSDKKKEGGKSGGTVSGRVITPESAPSPALGVKLPEKVMVRLYELDKLGKEVRPVDGVGPQELMPNGNFSFSGVPGNLVNLILRVEREDSSPVASALVPVVRETGSAESGIIVGAESGLEVKVFMEMVKSGFQQAADTEPAHIDAVFIKSVVTPEAVTAEGASATTLVPDFVAAAKSALLEYSRSLTGEERPPSNPTLKSIRESTRGAEAEFQSALEDAFYSSRPIEPGRLEKLQQALSDAEKDAIAGVSLSSREMPEAALFARARRNIAQRFVMCLKQGEKAENCPAMKSSEELRKKLADAAELSLNDKEAVFTTWSRWNRLMGTDGAPPAATATVDVGTPFAAFSRLLNIPPKTERGARDIMRKSWAEISATAPSSPQRNAAVNRMRARLRNLRNYLLTTYLGETPQAIRQTEDELLRAGESLDSASRERKSAVDAVETEWLRLQQRADVAILPMGARAEARFSALNEDDRKKIYWAARELILLTSLFDLDPRQYDPADSDGDGVPDAKEKALSTNPLKETSRPAPPLAASPASSLPAPFADADDDGFTDPAELAAGTKPDSADAALPLDSFLLCPTIEPVNCQKPGDGVDNDSDGKTDEEAPDGLDNDHDYRIDEDTAEAPPETAPPQPVNGIPLGKGSRTEPGNEPAAPEAEDKDTVSIRSAPATATFSLDGAAPPATGEPDVPAPDEQPPETQL